jgi:hypothetical protein
MKRAVLLLCGTVVFFAGCGPMQMPMAPLLKEMEQKQIDEAWDKALTPVDKLDRRRWLDALVASRAYEAGVDKLSFHSEKKFSGGLVVMEVVFDRLAPANDYFRVEVFDQAGKRIREESYGREEVEQVYNDLWVNHPSPVGPGPEPEEVTRKREAFEARWKEIVEIFPKARDKQDKID